MGPCRRLLILAGSGSGLGPKLVVEMHHFRVKTTTP